MNTNFFQYPQESWIVERTEPFLVYSSDVHEAKAALSRADVSVLDLDLTGARSATDIVSRLKAALPLPEWCGSSWDSVFDASAELRDGIAFPAALVVTGLDDLLRGSVHTALETVCRLDEMARAWSEAGEQLGVLYVVGRRITDTTIRPLRRQDDLP